MEHQLGPGAQACVVTTATLHQHVAQQQQGSQQPSPVQHLIHHQQHHQVQVQQQAQEDHMQQQVHHQQAQQHQQHPQQQQHHQQQQQAQQHQQPQHHQLQHHPQQVASRTRPQGQQHFCLRWNNFQMNITSVFEHLLRSETFVDVTLACDGSQIKAHKVVLSACSPYFQQLLSQNPCKHPIIILPAEVRLSEMKSIIDFVYRGEIDVAQEQLPDLLKVADALQIKGLCEVTERGGVTASARGRNRNLHSYRPALRHSRLNHPYKYRRRHLETLTRRAYGRTKVGGFGGRMASNGGMGSSMDDVKTETMEELVIKKENVGTQVLLHTSPTGVSMATLQPQPQTQAHHQPQAQPQPQDGQQENQYFVLKPVGQHMGPSGHQTPTGVDMLSPAGIHVQQSDNSMVMMMAAAAGDAGDHGDYGQHHQYQQQQQVTYQAPPTPVSIAYPMTATPQGLQAQMGEGGGGMAHTHHHQGQGHLQHHVLKDEASDTDSSQFAVGPELLGLVSASGSSMAHAGSQASECVMGSPSPTQHQGGSSSMKNWTEQDLEQALDALRQKSMSLTRASAHFGIPSTTLWQRAHRAGVDIPRHMSPMKTWTDDDLRAALEAMRAGTLSAHRASKEYGIPSSTLYKIAKKEGIKLAQPFNSTPPSWSRDDLRRAFDAIKSGMSVTKASTEFGIPSGTLYGKCRREGIELRGSKESANWSEEDLTDALEAVRVGEMSINQASLHFNVPYSTLYNRFRKCAMAEEEEEGEGPKPGDPDMVDSQRMAMVGVAVGGSDIHPDEQHMHHHHVGVDVGPQVMDGSSSNSAGQVIDGDDVVCRQDSRMGSPSELQQQHYAPESYQQQGQIALTTVPQS